MGLVMHTGRCLTLRWNVLGWEGGLKACSCLCFWRSCFAAGMVCFWHDVLDTITRPGFGFVVVVVVVVGGAQWVGRTWSVGFLGAQGEKERKEEEMKRKKKGRTER